MDLRANAIITAVDRFSGPIQRMAGAMNQFAGRAAVVANASKRVGAAVGGVGLTGAFGMGMLLQQAERFNRAVFGVGVASVGEAMDKFGKVDVSRMTGDMERIERSSMEMSQKLRLSATTVSEIHETLAKAGLPAERLAAAAEATAILAKTDFETPANKMAEFMHVISIVQKPLSGETFGDFMRRQADMVNLAASETRLSVGGIMEGLRQFQPIGASMGLSTEEMLAMLMAGVRSGFNPIELGTSLKSSMARAWKPTAGGMYALNSILGPMGKSLSDYTLASAQDPRRAASALQSSLGYVKGGFRTEIEKMLYDASREGYTTSEGFLQELTRKLAQKGGFNDMKDLQRIENFVRSAVLVPGQQIDIIRMWKDFVKGGGDIAQFVNYFEGRHLARLLPFMESLKEVDGDSPYNRDVAMLRRAKGQGLDAIETLWGKSAFGNMKAMAAAWERIMTRLANSPGIQQFVNGLERVASTIEKADPAILKMAAWGAVGLVLAGPLAAGLSAVGTALAMPGMTALLAAGGLAALLGAGEMFKAPWIEDPEVPGGYWGTAPLAETWKQLSGLGGELAALGGDIADGIKNLFNIDPKTSLLLGGIDLLNRTLENAKDTVSWLRANWPRFLGGEGDKNAKTPGWLEWAREHHNSWLERTGFGRIAEFNRTGLPPLARDTDELLMSLRSWNPQVTGEAKVTFDPITIVIDGIARQLTQTPAQATIPLRTGTSLGDIGAP